MKTFSARTRPSNAAALRAQTPAPGKKGGARIDARPAAAVEENWQTMLESGAKAAQLKNYQRLADLPAAIAQRRLHALTETRSAQKQMPDNAPVIQLAGFTNNISPETETAVSLIKQETGVNAVAMNLPFTNGIAAKTERAQTITAEIDKTSVSSKKRKDDKNTLSKITGMARDEAFILLGADPQKFYDAGHLVGDQLLKGLGDQYSFALKNLAPQTSSFNAPAYANVMEDPIKSEAEQNKTVQIRVDLTYPKDYQVTLNDLLTRSIVQVEQDHGNGFVDIRNGHKNVAKDQQINIPRRIPKFWKMEARVKDGQKFSSFNLPADQASVKKLVPLAQVKDKARALTVSDPFRFGVMGSNPAVPGQEANKDDKKVSFQQVQNRVLEAKQWKPPVKNKISKTELLGALQTYFPGVESEQDLNVFFGIAKIEDLKTVEQLNEGLVKIMEKITGINIPFDQFSAFQTRFLAEMSNTRNCFEIGDQEGFRLHLHNAKVVLADFKETCETLVEAAQKFKISIMDRIKNLESRNEDLSTIVASLTGKISTPFLEQLCTKRSNTISLAFKAMRCQLENNWAGALNNLQKIDIEFQQAQELIEQSQLQPMAEQQDLLSNTSPILPVPQHRAHPPFRSRTLTLQQNPPAEPQKRSRDADKEDKEALPLRLEGEKDPKKDKKEEL